MTEHEQLVGQIVQYVFPKPTKKVFVEWKLNKLGSFALLTVVWSTFDQAFESGAFSSVKPDNNIFVVFIAIAYFLIWLAASFLASIIWLPRKDTIAVCYCVPAKSLAIGVPLTTVLCVGLSRAEESKLQIPMVIFQGLQVASASMLTIPFRRWMRLEEEAENSSIQAMEKGSNELSEKSVVSQGTELELVRSISRPAA